MTPARLSTVLLDLDGVVRHFDPDHVPRLEAERDLAPGALQAAAFEPTLLNLAVTGQITRAEWTRRVGEAVGSPAAAEAWLSYRGWVDLAVIEIVGELRGAGVVVAVLTNGTDTVPAEMAELGIADVFDAVFSSALIGYAKPDHRAFEHVCVELGVAATDVFFTDDTESKLSGAIEIGMTARLFEGVDQFTKHLEELVVGGA